jgi:hypothetical protein
MAKPQGAGLDVSRVRPILERQRNRDNGVVKVSPGANAGAAEEGRRA